MKIYIIDLGSTPNKLNKLGYYINNKFRISIIIDSNKHKCN